MMSCIFFIGPLFLFLLISNFEENKGLFFKETELSAEALAIDFHS